MQCVGCSVCLLFAVCSVCIVQWIELCVKVWKCALLRWAEGAISEGSGSGQFFASFKCISFFPLTGIIIIISFLIRIINCFFFSTGSSSLPASLLSPGSSSSTAVLSLESSTYCRVSSILAPELLMFLRSKLPLCFAKEDLVISIEHKLEEIVIDILLSYFP